MTELLKFDFIVNIILKFMIKVWGFPQSQIVWMKSNGYKIGYMQTYPL